MKEIWKDIEGYEGLYQVSNLGRVKSLPTQRNIGWANYTSKEKILKQCKNKYGYLTVCLHKGDSQKLHRVHRLVAIAFIDNPNGYKCVNHKDEDKTNNNISNLEFCSYSYNVNYGTRNQRASDAMSKKVLQYTKDGVFVAEWGGTREAQRQTGVKSCNISLACRGLRKSSGDFVWKYKND